MTTRTELAVQVFAGELAAGHSGEDAARSADMVVCGSYVSYKKLGHRLPGVTVGEPQPPEWVPEGCEPDDGLPEDPYTEMPDEVWMNVGDPPREEDL